MSEGFANATEFTVPILLAAPVDETATSFVVSESAPPSLWGAQARFRIDNELILMMIPGDGSSPWMGARGAEGSTVAAHGLGALVEHVLTVASVPLLSGVAGEAVIRGAADTAETTARVIADAAEASARASADSALSSAITAAVAAAAAPVWTDLSGMLHAGVTPVSGAKIRAAQVGKRVQLSGIVAVTQAYYGTGIFSCLSIPSALSPDPANYNLSPGDVWGMTMCQDASTNAVSAGSLVFASTTAIYFFGTVTSVGASGAKVNLSGAGWYIA